MNTSTFKQIMTILLPGLFPLLREDSKGRTNEYYIFTIIFIFQWLIHLSIIKHLLLGIIFANASMLLLLLVNPYWCLDLNTCFGKDNRQSLENRIVRIGIYLLLIYSPPPIIAGVTVLFIKIFFLSEVNLTTMEIISKYISWTIYHKVSLWMVFTGYSVLQFRPLIQLEFYKFFFNTDPCNEQGYTFTSIGAAYYYGMFIIAAIFATFLSFENSISMLW